MESFLENVKADYTLAIGLYKIGLTQDLLYLLLRIAPYRYWGAHSKLFKIDKKILVTYKDIKNIDLPFYQKIPTNIKE